MPGAENLSKPEEELPHNQSEGESYDSSEPSDENLSSGMDQSARDGGEGDSDSDGVYEDSGSSESCTESGSSTGEDELASSIAGAQLAETAIAEA
ncbi:hypothetical protein FOZ62_016151, partial [Perkinsus olseni]